MIPPVLEDHLARQRLNNDNLLGHRKFEKQKHNPYIRSTALSSNVVAISQPTFLPWLGYFSILDAVDDFVFLDDVAFTHRSWQQRNRVRGPQGLQWIIIPVKTANRRDQLIQDAEIDTEFGFPEKQLNSLRHLYGKSSNWSTVGEIVAKAMTDATSHKSLSKMNCELVTSISRCLGIQTRFHLASELKSEAGRSEKLASIVEGFGARTYLSTPGSADYLLEEKESFDRRGIKVEIHQYEHPVYTQRFEPFISHASIVDLIFSPTTDPLALIRSGRKSPVDVRFWEASNASFDSSRRS